MRDEGTIIDTFADTRVVARHDPQHGLVVVCLERQLDDGTWAKERSLRFGSRALPNLLAYLANVSAEHARRRIARARDRFEERAR